MKKIIIAFLLLLLVTLLFLSFVLIPFFNLPDITIYESTINVTISDWIKYTDETSFLICENNMAENVYMTDESIAQKLELDIIKGNFFDNAAINRGDLVAVVSNEYATTHFFSNDIIGEKVLIDNRYYTVCGVYDVPNTLLYRCAGINEIDLIFIPYTTVSGWQDANVSVFIGDQNTADVIKSIFKDAKIIEVLTFKNKIIEVIICSILFSVILLVLIKRNHCKNTLLRLVLFFSAWIVVFLLIKYGQNGNDIFTFYGVEKGITTTIQSFTKLETNNLQILYVLCSHITYIYCIYAAAMCAFLAMLERKTAVSKI